jgi:hypothetical protein
VLSFGFVCELVSCGRRKVEAAWVACFAAFGFFASRFLRLRPLAKAVLLDDAYGEFFCALLVSAWPVAEISWPAPRMMDDPSVCVGTIWKCPAWHQRQIGRTRSMSLLLVVGPYTTCVAAILRDLTQMFDYRAGRKPR